jgi:ribosomal protein L24E
MILEETNCGYCGIKIIPGDKCYAVDVDADEVIYCCSKVCVKHFAYAIAEDYEY